MILSKAALLIFAVAQGVHAKLEKNLYERDIDCADVANVKDAMCVCRIKENHHIKICNDFKSKNGAIDGFIINGEEVEPNVYPWFARATFNSGWAGCGGSLVTPG